MKNSRWIAAYAVGVYAFLHVPLLVLAVFSFNASKFTVWQGFSLEWYKQAFASEALVESAWNSLWIALASTAIATVVGTLCAYGIWKRNAPLLSSSLYLSLMTPEIVTGVSLLALFQWTFRFLHLQLGMHTVILAHVAFCLAYVVITVITRLRTFDASLEEAAMDLGASEWQAFRLVTLPAILPGVIAAGLLAFTVSIDDYVITSLVAGVDSETLPMVVYQMARRGVSPVVNAISTLLVLLLGVLIVMSERLQRRV